MFQGEMRFTHFPYCLERLDDGRYVVLNRRHKPLGFLSAERVTYEDYPVAVKLKGLTEKLAMQLDIKGRPHLDKIRLYDDGTIPTTSQANMDAYLKRLGLLMKLKTYAEAV